MKFETLDIADVKRITPKRFGDNRGYFNEVFRDAWFKEFIADVTFVQDNESLSCDVGTIRDLHFQLEPFAQGKLVRHLVSDVGAEVLNIDKLTYAGNLASLMPIENSPNHRFVRADICDRAAINEAFETF